MSRFWSRARVISGRVRWSALALVVVVLLVAGCGTSSTGPGASATATATSPAATATTSASPSPTTPALTGTVVKVFFSQAPQALETNLTAVTAVNRISPTQSVATFALQMLIAGPTPDERARGMFSEMNGMFTGPSTCNGSLPVGGPDFTLTLNMKGSTPEQGTATLKFCRQTALAGVGTGARIGTEIDKTLLQFPTIKKVVILDVSGSCWNDLSGQNVCLK